MLTRAQIRIIQATDTLQLRRDVLYPSLSILEVQVEHDAEGLHFGVYFDDQLVTVVSLFENDGIAQFRKFATAKDMQGRGLGSLLLQHIYQFCQQKNIHTLWCNARTSAMGFYLRHHFRTVGQVFYKNNLAFIRMEINIPSQKSTQTNMKIIPAIDIIDGKCVRLTQGDYAQKKVYNEHPLEVAKEFEDAGIERLHLVDLDGAKKGAVVNWKVLEAIAGKTKLVIDFGGGIKRNEDINIVFESGAALATVGSIAVKDPALFASWVEQYGADKIFLGADVKDEKIAVGGWLETTDVSIYDFLAEKAKIGVTQVFCTDIAKDGLLQGPSTELYKKIIAQFPQMQLVASGGVSNMDDLYELQAAGCTGAIVGKAIYEGKISIAELKAFMQNK